MKRQPQRVTSCCNETLNDGRPHLARALGSLTMPLCPIAAALPRNGRRSAVAKGEQRCWPGYEPVPGKPEHSQGSCRPKAESKLTAAQKRFRSKRKAQLSAWQKKHPKKRRSAAQHLGKPGAKKPKRAAKKRSATSKRTPRRASPRKRPAAASKRRTPSRRKTKRKSSRAKP
jgi:hypothetical protein